MEIKEKIKLAIETTGVDMEKLKDLFSLVCLCEDKDERRKWLLYVRSEARKLRSAESFDLGEGYYRQGLLHW